VSLGTQMLCCRHWSWSSPEKRWDCKLMVRDVSIMEPHHRMIEVFCLVVSFQKSRESPIKFRKWGPTQVRFRCSHSLQWQNSGLIPDRCTAALSHPPLNLSWFWWGCSFKGQSMQQGSSLPILWRGSYYWEGQQWAYMTSTWWQVVAEVHPVNIACQLMTDEAGFEASFGQPGHFNCQII
jgi:hypothetical protein